MWSSLSPSSHYFTPIYSGNVNASMCIKFKAHITLLSLCLLLIAWQFAVINCRQQGQYQYWRGHKVQLACQTILLHTPRGTKSVFACVCNSVCWLFCRFCLEWRYNVWWRIKFYTLSAYYRVEEFKYFGKTLTNQRVKFNLFRQNSLFFLPTYELLLNIQGVPGGMWNTSGECSLC